MKQLKIILEDRLADLLEYQTIEKRDFVSLVLADIVQDKATPPNPQHGREIDNCKNCTPNINNVHDKNCPCIMKCECSREPDKVKPLAQYLSEYVKQEVNLPYAKPKIWSILAWRKQFEQALDAYQSTENVTIKIERNVR